MYFGALGIRPERMELTADYIYGLTAGLLTESNTSGFAAVKDETHIIVHLYVTSGNLDDLRDASDRFASNLLDILPDKNAVFVASGKLVTGLAGAEESYRTAVIALQHMFFNGYSVYGYNENQTPAYSFNTHSDHVRGASVQARNRAIASAHLQPHLRYQAA
ncbi:hypothetical protein [Paenibacillus harenae]|uniref:hypothetical protein n=1 Tax=Paenibacillus harenae TaxID=306543 RepID=UPI0003F966C4|nr:hypothetical protein [Paenibacillus harenae]